MSSTVEDRNVQAEDNISAVSDSILILVDVQNLYYTVRDAYGLASRVDFRKIREHAIRNRKFRHIVSIAYIASPPREIPKEFITALEKLSYEVKIASIRSHEQGKASATNIDVMLAADAQGAKVNGKQPDIVVVASGDSDYIPIYNALKEKGIRVEVMAFQMSLATAIHEVADEVFVLDRSFLYSDYKEESSQSEAPAQ